MPEVYAYNNDALRDYIQLCGAARPQDGRLFIVGVRGATVAREGHLRLTEQRLDQWDDLLILGGPVLHGVVASVDPGRPYTVAPLNREGAAHLLSLEELRGLRLPVEPAWFRFGDHRGNPALVQADGVAIRRDRDRDGKAEPGEPVFLDQEIGLNNHEGGSVLRPVGKWSAGCQVVPREYWDRYYRTARETCRGLGQTRVPYYLLLGQSLAAFLRERKA